MGHESFMPSQELSTDRAVLLGHLEFGRGEIGKGAVTNPAEMGQILGNYVRPLTVHNTADCIDGRAIISFSDESVSDESIYLRVAEQLPGGLGFAVTRAAVGANMAIVRDAKDFTEAYIIVHHFLKSLGYEDSGHVGCAASALLEQSEEQEVDLGASIESVGMVRPLPEHVSQIAKTNHDHKKEFLARGFYSSWDSNYHEDFLHENVPHNFAVLESDATTLAGHREELAMLIGKTGYGLAKNQLVNETGHMALGLTTASVPRIVRDISQRIKASSLEQARFLYEFDSSSMNVFNAIGARGLDIYGI